MSAILLFLALVLVGAGVVGWAMTDTDPNSPTNRRGWKDWE